MTYQPSYEQMHNITPEPGALDPRCRTGRALCVDKSTNSLRWVIDGKVQKTLDVRFGSDELPTREGAFTVFEKSRDHVSSLYDTSMPLAMFFSGGQAVHYSPGLRGERLQRRLARLRQRSRLRRHLLAVRPGADRRQGHRVLVLACVPGDSGVAQARA